MSLLSSCIHGMGLGSTCVPTPNSGLAHAIVLAPIERCLWVGAISLLTIASTSVLVFFDHRLWAISAFTRSCAQCKCYLFFYTGTSGFTSHLGFRASLEFQCRFWLNGVYKMCSRMLSFSIPLSSIIPSSPPFLTIFMMGSSFEIDWSCTPLVIRGFHTFWAGVFAYRRFFIVSRCGWLGYASGVIAKCVWSPWCCGHLVRWQWWQHQFSAS